MAHIVPSISFLTTMKRQIQGGNSVSTALQLTLVEEKTDFSIQVRQWHAYQQSSQDKASELAKTHYQSAFFEILKSGLDGAPVYELLEELENEMVLEFERQWKLYLDRLPLILSLPLLLFFFPSYVILMFGPLLTQFLSEVN